MERLNRENCLQEKTGSCTGCPVQKLALEKLKTDEPNQRIRIHIIREISDNLCPKGNTLQARNKEQRGQSMW